jgi:ribosomal protein L32
MANQYIGECSCFLCGTHSKLLPHDDGLYHFVECPNCGKYKLSEQLKIEIDNGIYHERSFSIISGEVFNAFYYKNEIKMVKTTDFRTIETITTVEKLYRLAKYIYTETVNVGDIRQRPAVCCCKPYDDPGNNEYHALMQSLKKKDIITFNYALDDNEDVTALFFEIAMTIEAKMHFEKG